MPNYLNSTLTGVMHIAASLTFYEADASHPAPPVPDQVIGLGTHYVSSGDPTDFGVSGLPRNLERAKLELEREEKERSRNRMRRGDDLMSTPPSPEAKLRPA